MLPYLVKPFGLGVRPKDKRSAIDQGVKTKESMNLVYSIDFVFPIVSLAVNGFAIDCQ